MPCARRHQRPILSRHTRVTLDANGRRDPSGKGSVTKGGKLTLKPRRRITSGRYRLTTTVTDSDGGVSETRETVTVL